MVQLPEPKKAVALIRNAFADKGTKLQTKEAYNLLAQLWGYRDWATYRGMNPKKAGEHEAPTVKQAPVPYARQASEIADWPTWVVCNRMGDDDEELWLLPYGATIENRLGPRRSWPMLNDRDAVRLTVGFVDPDAGHETFQQFVVATHVACEHSDSDQYGFPMYANDREVAQWLEETMGWGYLADAKGRSLVDVLSHDRGDDGHDDWWVELKVHPAVHERLLTQFEPKNLDFECVWPNVVLDEPYLSAHKPGYDPRVAELRKELGKVFADLDGKPLMEVSEALSWDDSGPSAEATLRARMHCDLVTLQGPAEQMTISELRAYLVEAIGRAKKVPV